MPNGRTSSETDSGLSITKIHDRIKNRYDRIALISHRAHVDLINPDDTDTLVISTDWLAWRQSLDRGGHCLHFEAFLVDWPEELGNPDTFQRPICKWMYVGGEDVTKFLGVSLGKPFNDDVADFALAHSRLLSALDAACEAYKPRELVFFDIRGEYNCLDEDDKKSLVETLAQRHRLTITDHHSRMSDDANAFHDTDSSPGMGINSGLRQLLRGVYETIVDLLFGIRALLAPARHRIFLFQNWLIVRSLCDAFETPGLAPVVLSGMYPKTPGFLLRCWRRGIFHAKLPAATLDAGDKEAIKKIIRELENAWITEGFELDETIRHFIQRRLIASGAFQTKARLTKRFDRLFARHRFKRILIGDAENSQCCIAADLAFRDGIETDELLNGMFMTKRNHESRTGDAHRPPMVSRLLAWGKQNEKWIAAINGDMPCVRTGYPVFDHLRRETAVGTSSLGRALVLPIPVERPDTRGLNANMFSTMVETVRALKNLGIHDIRIKVHPGPHNKRYFEDVVRNFSLDCAVFKDGLLAGHIEWADVVIGPINSGAFVETMMAGKPYYPMVIQPSSLHPDHFGAVTPLGSVPELIDAIKAGSCPDAYETLETFCSILSIPDPSRRVWQAMEASLPAPPSKEHRTAE